MFFKKSNCKVYCHYFILRRKKYKIKLIFKEATSQLNSLEFNINFDSVIDLMSLMQSRVTAKLKHFSC